LRGRLLRLSLSQFGSPTLLAKPSRCNCRETRHEWCMNRFHRWWHTDLSQLRANHASMDECCTLPVWRFPLISRFERWAALRAAVSGSMEYFPSSDSVEDECYERFDRWWLL